MLKMGSLASVKNLGLDLNSYHRFFANLQCIKTQPIEQSVQKGIRFLEFNCSAVYVFQMDVSKYPEMTNSTPAIPSLFESAFLLPILQNLNISRRVVENITSLILQNRRESGFWSYFYDSRILADDIDTASMAMYALLETGTMPKDECRRAGIHLLEVGVKYKGGAYNTYLPRLGIGTSPLVPFADKCRVDIGVLANFLVFLGATGLDTRKDLLPTLDMIDKALDDLLACKEFSQNIPNCRYYTNQHVLCFLISRYVRVSEIGALRFKDKLKRVCRDRLASGNGKSSVEIACRILSALNVDLHQHDEIVTKTLMDEADELRKHQNSDGSFDSYYFAQIIGHCYFGSRSFSTVLACGALEMVKANT